MLVNGDECTYYWGNIRCEAGGRPVGRLLGDGFFLFRRPWYHPTWYGGERRGVSPVRSFRQRGGTKIVVGSSVLCS